MLEMIDNEDLIARLKAHGSRFFSVVFFRRTDRPDGSQLQGDLRLLSGVRRGVRKHLAGGKPAYNFDNKKLLSVYKTETPEEHGKPGYRSIPWEGIIAVRLNGIVYIARQGWERYLMLPAATQQQWIERSMQGIEYVGKLLSDSGSPVFTMVPVPKEDA